MSWQKVVYNSQQKMMIVKVKQKTQQKQNNCLQLQKKTNFIFVIVLIFIFYCTKLFNYPANCIFFINITSFVQYLFLHTFLLHKNLFCCTIKFCCSKNFRSFHSLYSQSQIKKFLQIKITRLRPEFRQSKLLLALLQPALPLPNSFEQLRKLFSLLFTVFIYFFVIAAQNCLRRGARSAWKWSLRDYGKCDGYRQRPTSVVSWQ